MDRRTADTAAGSTGPGLPEQLVVRLLAVLAAAAGCLDVVCVVRLGGAFASVVTGNLVQLGLGIAIVNASLAIPMAVAVGTYGLGVAAATIAVGHHGAGWRRRTSLVAAGEWVLLAGVVAGWLAVHGRPDAPAGLLILAPAALAMGVQSAITISSGVPRAATTYLTGTLTNVVRTLTTAPHHPQAAAGGAGRLAALLVGAILGALLLRFAPLWAPVLPTLLVAAVVVTALRSAPARTA
jgi:uncharacterized membrane protein YoaK (UPF0700 family)